MEFFAVRTISFSLSCGACGDQDERTSADAVERAIDLLDGGAGAAVERGKFVDAPVRDGSGDEYDGGGDGPGLIVHAALDGAGITTT